MYSIQYTVYSILYSVLSSRVGRDSTGRDSTLLSCHSVVVYDERRPSRSIGDSVNPSSRIVRTCARGLLRRFKACPLPKYLRGGLGMGTLCDKSIEYRFFGRRYEYSD